VAVPDDRPLVEAIRAFGGDLASVLPLTNTELPDINVMAPEVPEITVPSVKALEAPAITLPDIDLASVFERSTITSSLSTMVDALSSLSTDSQTDLMDALEGLTTGISDLGAFLDSTSPPIPAETALSRTLDAMGTATPIGTLGVGSEGADANLASLSMHIENLTVVADNAEELTASLTQEMKREARRGGVTRLELSVSPRSVGA
jgi:hypothetical protein